MIKKELSGYPSIDKPWLKYYDTALTEEDIPKCSAFQMLYENNKEYLTDTALFYFNRKITYQELFSKIHNAAAKLKSIGIQEGDIITFQTLNMPQTVILFYACSYIGAIANIMYITAENKELQQKFTELTQELSKQKADADAGLQQCKAQAELMMERALFKKEREMQELLRQADKENARLEVLLEQAREQLKKENIDKDEQ